MCLTIFGSFQKSNKLQGFWIMYLDVFRFLKRQKHARIVHYVLERLRSLPGVRNRDACVSIFEAFQI